MTFGNGLPPAFANCQALKYCSGACRSREINGKFHFLTRRHRAVECLRFAGHLVSIAVDQGIAGSPCARTVVFNSPGFNELLAQSHLGIVGDVNINSGWVEGEMIAENGRSCDPAGQ